MNKDIYLSNSFGYRKDKFIPINENKIGMYVCGPTVYDDPHIGNARPLVVFDILYKVLKCRFGKNNVTYVDLIAEGTVVERIVKSLRNKINIANDIMGEDLKDWI